MMILLVDDNVPRLGKIIDHLVAHGVARQSIVDRRTSEEAKTYLKTNKVDLLILDLLVPRRVEETPSVAASLDLLLEISDTSRLIKPRKVVGLTAYSDAAATASDTFVERTWTIIESDEISTSWLTRIEKCVDYLRIEGEQKAPTSHLVDVLIITALRTPEMAAVLRLPWSWSPAEPFDDITFFSRGEFRSGRRSCSVIVANADRIGMVSTAVVACKLINRFRPVLCSMPGICAGIKGRATIGDVIFAESCWDYQSGKFARDKSGKAKFEVDSHQIPADPLLGARISELSEDKAFFYQLGESWPLDVASVPKLLRAPVASGSAVLADPSMVQKVIEQHRKVAAIEMELYGLYLAASQGSLPRSLAFGIKAVCDYADEKKNDDFQAYAAYTSAHVMKEFLERFTEGIVERDARGV